MDDANEIRMVVHPGEKLVVEVLLPNGETFESRQRLEKKLEDAYAELSRLQGKTTGEYYWRARAERAEAKLEEASSVIGTTERSLSKQIKVNAELEAKIWTLENNLEEVEAQTGFEDPRNRLPYLEEHEAELAERKSQVSELKGDRRKWRDKASRQADEITRLLGQNAEMKAKLTNVRQQTQYHSGFVAGDFYTKSLVKKILEVVDGF